MNPREVYHGLNRRCLVLTRPGIFAKSAAHLSPRQSDPDPSPLLHTGREVNACLVCLAAALSTGTSSQEWTTVYAPSSVWMAAVRGQNPTYDESPFLGDPTTQPFPPTFEGGQPAPSDGFLPPLQPATPTYDPFMNQQSPVVPYGAAAPPGGDCCGLGLQPYRLGWHHFHDFGYLPNASAGGGSLGITEFDNEWRYTTAAPGFYVFSTAPQFGTRHWTGPANGIHDLPNHVYRFGWDFELATPAQSPVSLLLGFNPSINSDLEQGLSSDAWQFDARAALFFRSTSYWTWVLGVMVWDRKDTFVLPWVGAIYNPTPRWEWRVMFPESRVSYFLGNYFGDRTWLYATAEFHVEAYEIGMGPSTAPVGLPGRVEQIQIQDWRALIGLRFDRGRYAKFIEAGWVFDREVDFAGVTPDFDVSSGFITRAGFRY